MDPYAFYTALPVRAAFADVTRPESYAPLPGDWTVVIGDVVDSTGALARGLYKEVNLVGSALLVATFNALGRHDFPFIFGGDGATLALPAAEALRARPAFAATRAMARAAFGLDLRVGAIPAADLYRDGHDIGIARIRLSDHFALAALNGSGIHEAERRIKHPGMGGPLLLTDEAEPPAGAFDGLECRWKRIPSPRGETLALLAVARAADRAGEVRVLGEVFATVSDIVGDGAGHPVAEADLRLTRAWSDVAGEAGVHAPRGGVRRALAQARAWIASLLGEFLMRRGWRIGGVDFGRYRPDVVRNTDYRKFDGVLRMVIAATPGQRAALVDALERQYVAGRLAYGVHVAREATMTCLVFERQGAHLHFIDGAGGGYARAAVDLKRRLRDLELRAR